MNFYTSALSLPYPFGTNVVIDDKARPVTTTIMAEDAVDRNYLSAFVGGYGEIPGFPCCPYSGPFLYWRMRRYATIVLAHTVVTAQIIAGERSIEIVDDGGKADLAETIKQAATKDLLPPLNNAFAGAVESLHFGQWLQEVIWGLRRGRTVPTDCRSFLPGEAIIHVDKRRQFVGYEAGGEFRDARYGFLCVNEPHIDPILGHSRNENAKLDWWRKEQSELNADKVERKAAGIQMALGVPIGKTFKDADGNAVLPKDVLTTIINAAVTGKSFTYPMTPFTKDAIEKNPALAEVPGMKIDKFDWGGIGESLKAHLERLDRLDRNMIRAWHRPERESTEGHFGTKAESGVQGQLGTTDSELVHQQVCTQWDAQVTRTWQLANFPGAEEIIIRTKPAPLSDPQQTFLQDLTKAAISDQRIGPELSDHLSERGLLLRVEAPVVDEKEAEQNRNERLAADKAKQDAQQPPPNATSGANGNGQGNGKTGSSGIAPRTARALNRMVKGR